jgi:tetratricopeptide (TPR) repeat protein
MAIVKKTLKDVPAGTKSAYTKALQVMNQNNLQYAITLFKEIVQFDPGFLDAREKLRKCERDYSEKMSAVAKTLSTVKALGHITKGNMLKAKKPKEAMNEAEEALAFNLFNPAALTLLAESAKKLDAMFIAVEAYELIVEHDDKNEANIVKLGEYYKADGQGIKYLTICQKLADKYPGDLEKLALLREAAALASMEKGKWGQGGESDFKKNLNKSNTDQGDRIIRAEDDIREMIEKYSKEIAEGNESIDTRRRLAELYLRSEEYEKAIEAYNWIVEKMGTLDPAIDKAIEKANTAISKRKVEQMKAEGRPQEEIDAEIKANYDYRMERFQDRIRLYPNDLQIRFEYAELLWEGGAVDDALEQFQIAQRNPQHRLIAIVYLGRCFAAKNQFDMAIEQFNRALEDMPTMNADKMFTLYHLGCTYDLMGKKKEALDCFKQIYAVDIKYLDVAERINKYYEENK